VNYKYYAGSTSTHYAYLVRASEEQAERCASPTQHRSDAGCGLPKGGGDQRDALAIRRQRVG